MAWKSYATARQRKAKTKKCLHCSARVPAGQAGGNCKTCQAKYEASQRKTNGKRKAARKNPAGAKFGKWYKHPKGGMVRVRNSGGKIIVDIKK